MRHARGGAAAWRMQGCPTHKGGRCSLAHAGLLYTHRGAKLPGACRAALNKRGRCCLAPGAGLACNGTRSCGACRQGRLAQLPGRLTLGRTWVVLVVGHQVPEEAREHRAQGRHAQRAANEGGAVGGGLAGGGGQNVQGPAQGARASMRAGMVSGEARLHQHTTHGQAFPTFL